MQPHGPLWITSLALSIAVTTWCNSAAPVALFDGQTLNGWDILTCDAQVQDGAILLKAGDGLVQTERKYRDFILDLEWKALRDDNWDSGIYFRYPNVPTGRPWPQRYQVNLRKGMEGNLDAIPTGKNPVPIKPGEWNRFILTVRGPTAALTVNGSPAWQVDDLEELESHIALQAEVPGGGQFLFRKIQLTDLSR
jgi:hypothetical protein